MTGPFADWMSKKTSVNGQALLPYAQPTYTWYVRCTATLPLGVTLTCPQRIEARTNVRLLSWSSQRPRRYKEKGRGQARQQPLDPQRRPRPPDMTPTPTVTATPTATPKPTATPTPRSQSTPTATPRQSLPPPIRQANANAERAPFPRRQRPGLQRDRRLAPLDRRGIQGEFSLCSARDGIERRDLDVHRADGRPVPGLGHMDVGPIPGQQCPLHHSGRRPAHRYGKRQPISSREWFHRPVRVGVAGPGRTVSRQ